MSRKSSRASADTLDTIDAQQASFIINDCRIVARAERRGTATVLVLSCIGGNFVLLPDASHQVALAVSPELTVRERMDAISKQRRRARGES